MSKWKIDRKRMKRREGMSGKTTLFILLQTSLILIFNSISPYLMVIGFALVPAFWWYASRKNSYYTWERYFLVFAIGTLLAIIIFYVMGGGG